MSPRGRRAAIGLVIAAGAIGGVVVIASTRAEPPARCAAGMIALGARCCGEGQRLEGDRCAGPPSRCAAGMEATPGGCVARSRIVPLAGGTLHVGPGDWEAQGVVARRDATIAPFGLDSLEVTEQRWAACVAAGACPAIALTGEPGRALSRVTLDEAARFCRWAGGALPTSDQLAFAAAGASGRRYAWGDTGVVCRRAAWGLVEGPCGWGATGPELSGSHPDGASPDEILDLAGNVAEWSAGGEVRGGSYADGVASALRAWQKRAVASGARWPGVGFRCAYPPTASQPN